MVLAVLMLPSFSLKKRQPNGDNQSKEKRRSSWRVLKTSKQLTVYAKKQLKKLTESNLVTFQFFSENICMFQEKGKESHQKECDGSQ